MANKHLPNRELGILDSTTDFFGHIDKGNAIVSFLRSNIESMSQSNMIALYGKWGSGKSTLMKYIGTELEKGDFKSLYFPAWEYEKDENLPLSLLHFISDETGTSKMQVVKNLLKLAADASLSAIKSITIDAGVVKVNPKVIIDSANEYFEKEKEKNKSKYSTTKEFKKKFIDAEKEIVKKLSKHKLIIFIDDLDRCEPENVLNLIGIIKLFFTYSENIVFVFGCDKDAISKAVQHKYGDIIRADEYLEKVIDVSFNMPSEISIKSLIEFYFPGDIKGGGNNSIKICEDLEGFFKSIGFTNPRHLKKILNKFEIVKSFEKLNKDIGIQNGLIPKTSIDTEEDLMMVKFVLLFIILHEFYNETFNVLMRFDQKKVNYTNACKNHLSKANNNSTSFKTANEYLNNNFLILNSLDSTFNEIQTAISKRISQGQNSEMSFNYFLTIFTPILHSNTIYIGEGRQLISQFYNNNTAGDILTLKFCEYLWEKKQIVLSIKSDYKIIDFFKMCQILL